MKKPTYEELERMEEMRGEDYIKLCKAVDALEAKCAELDASLAASIRLREILDEDVKRRDERIGWQADMLERAKPYLHDANIDGVGGAEQWLADLEKGPK